MQRIHWACLVGLIVVILFVVGCTKSPTGSIVIDTTKKPPVEAGTTFRSVPGDVCMEGGKPVVRLFATTWCPHCQWVKPGFSEVVREYQDAGKIVGHLWEMDVGDDALTPEKEAAVPDSELAIFKQFNSKGSVPTFVFGCTRVRIGNAYEAEDDLEKEKAEFRGAIEQLLKTEMVTA